MGGAAKAVLPPRDGTSVWFKDSRSQLSLAFVAVSVLKLFLIKVLLQRLDSKTSF